MAANTFTEVFKLIRTPFFSDFPFFYLLSLFYFPSFPFFRENQGIQVVYLNGNVARSGGAARYGRQ